jgi:hypothetical protein
MINYTTPAIPLIVEDRDLTQGQDVYVSFEQGFTELTKTGTDLTITTSSRGQITDSNIVLVLTQEESAMFNLKQAVTIQVNWINAAGVREATEQKRISVFRNLLDKVIAYGD